METWIQLYAKSCLTTTIVYIIHNILIIHDLFKTIIISDDINGYLHEAANMCLNLPPLNPNAAR